MEAMSTARIATVLATLVLTLTACGSEDAAGGGGTEHNDADVAFATEMIPHHAGALVMVDMTMGRDLDPEVRELTEDIRAAQTPEIETMADWLQEWGEPVPETPRDHANAHSGGHGAGMEGLAELESASGEAFEDRWLQMMIEHHEGAIDMAQEEQEEGAYAPAIKLAEEIEESQQAEIDKMQELLGS
jgi:uncharacterized protein (DUF305 family)